MHVDSEEVDPPAIPGHRGAAGDVRERRKRDAELGGPAFVITGLVEVSPASGEMVVASRAGDGSLPVIGRIKVPG